MSKIIEEQIELYKKALEEYYDSDLTVEIALPKDYSMAETRQFFRRLYDTVEPLIKKEDQDWSDFQCLKALKSASYEEQKKLLASTNHSTWKAYFHKICFPGQYSWPIKRPKEYFRNLKPFRPFFGLWIEGALPKREIMEALEKRDPYYDYPSIRKMTLEEMTDILKANGWTKISAKQVLETSSRDKSFVFVKGEAYIRESELSSGELLNMLFQGERQQEGCSCLKNSRRKASLEERSGSNKARDKNNESVSDYNSSFYSSATWSGDLGWMDDD